MSTTPPALPTVTVNVGITFAISVAQDINTHWLSKQQGSPGTLAAAMAATDTTLTVTPGAPQGVGFTPNVTVGSTILIDSEPMTATAINGNQYTVTRAVSPMAPTPVAHAAGATIYLQTYPTPWALIADEALRPWAQQVVASLGPNSATFGAQATGSITAST